jgi:hypothetical protein
VLVAIGTIPFIGWIVALSAVDAYERFDNGDAVSGAVLWPTWIPSFIVAAGFALLILRLALDAAALVAAIMRNAPRVDGESPARSEGSVDIEDAL